MFDKLTEVEKRYQQLQNSLMEPGVANDQTRYRTMMKELSTLEEVVNAFRDYKKTTGDLQGNVQILETENDEEMRAMAKEEISSLEARKTEIENKLKILLLPKDPNDDKNIILEIRAGAGGDEAGLFASELYRAYSHYASEKGWKVEPMSLAEGSV